MLMLEQLVRACPQAPVSRLAIELPLFNASLVEADATTPSRVALLMAHTLVETAELSKFEENLNYSPEAMVRVWPQRFPTYQAAQPYARNPERLANHVYADRLGNGDETSGEGWKYRGRGSLQITGRDRYLHAGSFLGLDLVGHPELAAAQGYAFRVGAWYWRSHGLNALADRGDLFGSTRVINGGTTELKKRKLYFDRLRLALGLFGSC